MAALELRHSFRTENSIFNARHEHVSIVRLAMRYSARRCRRNRLELLRHWRALRNGTYLTRAHLARRPRAFHWVCVGDRVHVWKWVRGLPYQTQGCVEAVGNAFIGSPVVRVNGEWFKFANNCKNGFHYVH